MNLLSSSDATKTKKIIQNTMQRLTDILNHPIHIEETDVYITASIGIAMYPSDADNPEELLQKSRCRNVQCKRYGEKYLQFL